jgi:hypothetical protein
MTLEVKEYMRGGSITGMPIYDKSTRALMRQMVSEMPIAKGQVVAKDAILNWFATHYPNINCCSTPYTTLDERAESSPLRGEVLSRERHHKGALGSSRASLYSINWTL